MVNIFDAYTKQLKEKGLVSVTYSSSSGNDPQAQINEIRNMAAKGYNAIIVNAASPTALAPILNQMAARGIIIVAFDNTVDSDKIYNVNTDQIAFGRTMAEWLMKEIGGKGNIFIIKGVEGTTVSRDRNKGFHEVLDKYPDVKVLQEGWGKWDPASTGIEINNMLAAHKGEPLAGILDEGGGEFPIYEALKRFGYDPTKVPQTGEFGNGFFRIMVKEGVKGTACGQPPYLSAAAVDIALKVWNGEKVEKYTIIPTPMADYRTASKWYIPGQSDQFFCDWTDPDNTWNLKIEDILIKK
jgi:ribose transport system substrate-binding protein